MSKVLNPGRLCEGEVPYHLDYNMYLLNNPHPTLNSKESTQILNYQDGLELGWLLRMQWVRLGSDQVGKSNRKHGLSSDPIHLYKIGLRIVNMK